jgi:hypothetical protein
MFMLWNANNDIYLITCIKSSVITLTADNNEDYSVLLDLVWNKQVSCLCQPFLHATEKLDIAIFYHMHPEQKKLRNKTSSVRKRASNICLCG